MITVFKNYQLLKRFPVFCNKLRSLLKSGFNIQKALQIIKADEKDEFYRQRLENLEKELLAGKPWIQAFALLLPEYLPFKFEGLDKVPKIECLLAELENYYKNKLNFISEFWAKLTYPLLLFLISFFAFFFFLSIILPMYQNYFLDLNLTIPKSLSLLIIFWEKIKENIVLIVAVIFFILIFWGQKIINFIEKLIYKLLFNLNIADILWIFSILLESGIDIKSALNSIKINKPENLKENFENFKKELFLGQAFSQALIKNFNFSNFQKEQINSAEQRTDFGELLAQISQEIKIQDMKQMINKLNYIQPIAFFILGGIIFIFLYLIFIPVINTISIIT
jgi:type II secretory pathway component PulF